MGESVLLKEMGQRIMTRRKSLHFTQEELVEKIDVSTQMISNLECGKKAIRPENPNVVNLRKVGNGTAVPKTPQSPY